MTRKNGFLAIFHHYQNVVSELIGLDEKTDGRCIIRMPESTSRKPVQCIEMEDIMKEVITSG